MSSSDPATAPGTAAEPADDLDVGPEELALALRVLGAVAADRALLASVDAPTRERLQRVAGEVARPGHDQRRRLRKALLRREREARKARDEALRRETGIRRLREAPVFPTPLPPGAPRHALPGAASAPAAADGSPELAEPRKCYVCKAPYRRLHRFYDQLCPACGDENLAHRTACADLRGRVAIVTGARVKIGYQAAVLLLRAGCRVLACTRFPRDAAARYAREPDFDGWRDRLSIHGVDLRHTPSMEALCHELDRALPRLDFQVHNACQTVRRPPGFYAHLVAGEEGPAPPLPPGAEALVARTHGPSPARLSQAPSEADLLLAAPGALEIFPRGVLDQDLQQVDLRAHNSWRLTLAEVPTLELLEVLLVNATAPFVMAARLKPLMLRSAVPPPGTATSADAARHVVMVSAVEGQFYREHKTDRHPHTNMAKAGLNMLVRTSAPDYARDGIHLNAVDTGWVTDEDPAHLAARKAEEHAFSPPLDVVDGAARILAPIFDGFRTRQHASGTFFKDYHPTPW
jgi:NAD(P)-dependent dehydrogenase (short-subunit alcohol dehydrogenase family)